MSEKNFSEYVVKNPIVEGIFAKRIAINGIEHFPELNYWLGRNRSSWSTPHSHDYDQILHIFGSDSSDITDFQAEVWVYLGDEGVKEVVNSPTIIYVPEGIPERRISANAAFRRKDTHAAGEIEVLSPGCPLCGRPSDTSL